MKWFAKIYFEGRRIWLGYFLHETEAARAYDAKAVELFGEFAHLDFPEEWPPDRRAQIRARHAEGKGEKGENVQRDKNKSDLKAPLTLDTSGE